MVSGRAFRAFIVGGLENILPPTGELCHIHQTEVMLMIEAAELIVAFIGALATVIGVVHTIRRDKRNDHKKENSRPGLDN